MSTVTGDVAIIGVGLHPFGRYPGKSALEMGEDAIYEALVDAGIDWTQIQTLFAGSMEVKNPEAIMAMIGLTGIPGRAVFTGCATGATSLAMAANAIKPFPLHTAPSPTVDASRQAYEMAGIGPEDVDVAQMQDTDAGSEVIHLAENGFCADGEQEAIIAAGDTEIGGRLPVNTDGGLLANGEPIGASGLRQIYELVNQLRGRCGERQVPDAKVGYAQLYGAPGAAAVTVLSR